jgi:hypothetical protein
MEQDFDVCPLDKLEAWFGLTRGLDTVDEKHSHIKFVVARCLRNVSWIDGVLCAVTFDPLGTTALLTFGVGKL